MADEKRETYTTHKTWDTGTRFQCTCGWVSHFMADEGSRSEGVSERAAHDATHKTTEGGLSQGDFAALAARIAQVAAQWSADALLPMREYDKTMDPGAVERFAEDILSRVYRLRERAYAKQ